MNLKLCGSDRFRAYTNQVKDRVFIENLQNRAVLGIGIEDWDEFYNLVKMANRRISDIREVGQ